MQTDANLLTIWDRVRKLDDAILEPLVKNGCVARLDESVFERSEDDEIILCLNYDGLYGINNVNRFCKIAIRIEVLFGELIHIKWEIQFYLMSRVVFLH